MYKIRTICLVLFLVLSHNCRAQSDTLNLMSYNVLYYGNGCQGPNGKYHEYFSEIVRYANPDIIGLVKMSSIKSSPDDQFSIAPVGFADSIIQFAMNAAYPGRYAYCPFTNNARTNNTALLIYDQRKLGFVCRVSTYVNITDFNTYKLYYKDPNLEKTHDTTFLYVILNHDKSGDDNEPVRDQQIKGEMEMVRKHFSRLPNMINMGDFNVRNSDERFYQRLTATDDTAFRFFDPPFFPDRSLKYPANWDHNAEFAQYFTTSTRESDHIPNPCGTGGGGKNWYDHIFLSSWIVNNCNYVGYIPHSFHVLGADGKRFKISINATNGPKNTSAPQEVLDALFQMSNKYPVMASLIVHSNTTGVSPADPEIRSSAEVIKEEVTVSNTDEGQFVVHFPDAMIGVELTVACYNKANEAVISQKFRVTKSEKKFKIKGDPGTYKITVRGEHNLFLEKNIERK